jgi:glutaredoxin
MGKKKGSIAEYMKNSPAVILVILVGIVGITLAAFALSQSAPEPSYPEGTLDDFAKCLTEKGAVMYGANWCSHCQQQKALFGTSFQYVDFVDCEQSPDLCSLAGITAFPTWIINGEKHTGTKPLDILAVYSECELG